KNDVVSSIFDGLGMGLGFAMALLMLGSLREILGSLSLFGMKFADADGILLFILPPGAFLALGFLIALINHLRKTA
ncbi:MAG: electron transport complex subunit RsxE, partial [Cyclobacteriaceae bacterium]|nr:electron transport complex subunit RsxE [Cyclobacteriaceae bacterium]